ncbi:MAG: L-proline dehydrogenase [Thermoleophilia bacterium]|nr:L-proline dehydrogenase [Thermoleophilia bacterium]
MPPATVSATEPGFFDRAIVRTVPLMPRGLVRRISAPYIAGATMAQAMATVQRLAHAGLGTTLDVLGEAISEREQAVATRDQYLAVAAALPQIAEVSSPTSSTGVVGAGVRNVSVKLTALGLGIDDALMHDNVAAIARAMADIGGFVRIDMEDSPYTDATLELFRSLRAEGHDNLGIVVQAYLRRTRADVEALAADGARVRVVKGIYVESAEIAFQDMGEINRSYLELCRALAVAGSHVAFATHDDELIDGCRALVADLELPPERYEFQMLLGVREGRRDELARAGHPTRVYVPFGAQWYEYSVRRLRENPRVAGHVARETLAGWRRRIAGGHSR